MQSGKPYKTYKKVVLGRVYVSAIDPFTEQPTGILLYGDPRRGDESCFIDMWSERDDLFFRKQNKVHFDSGFIVEVIREVKEVVELPFEQFSDGQLKEVINMKYLALQAKLNKTSSEAVLYRMIDLAQEMEKSTKIIGAIEARLSEVNTIKVTENKDDGSKT
jgi:cell fate (sporulation/competence/biofilm development) regulator YmcA (YheA/YmcA/DUF963 family)